MDLRRTLGLGTLGLSRLAEAGGNRGGQDPAEGQGAKESLPTGVAPIGRKTQPFLQTNKGALFDSLGGDVLKIEVPTARTVGV